MAGYGTESDVSKSKVVANDHIHETTTNDECDTGVPLTRKTLWSFYFSHACFMWNNRSYEFASVLFTASAFPDTLVAASIRGLSCHLASLLFSPAIGRWCSSTESRLRPVQACIIVQRLSIVLASLCWVLLFPGFLVAPPHLKLLIFALLMLLGMIERLSAVGNLVVIEREWLPLMARTEEIDEDTSLLLLQTRTPNQPKLHILNATTKRIDLITKLVAPIAISAIQLRSKSFLVTASVLALTQAISLAIELHLTKSVYSSTPSLQEPRPTILTTTTTINPDSTQAQSQQTILDPLHRWLQSFKSYARNPIFLPSLAYSLEPFSVLTLAGSMSSYLLIANFPLSQITAARTASTVVEMSSTVLTPVLIARLSRGKSPDRVAYRSGPLEVVGLLGLGWQVLCLIPATAVLLVFPAMRGGTALLTLVLFASLTLSRLGPFAFSLVEQQIVQLHVAEVERMEFSAVETALIDLSELGRWFVLGLFGKPSQFRWVAVLSFASVVASFLMFANWVRKTRIRL